MNIARRQLPKPTFLDQLSQKIKTDPLPIAVLWVEASLRPIWIRIAEYIYLKVCEAVAPNWAKQMTVGLAQMKVWLWKDFLKTEFGRAPTIHDWEDPIINFYAVKWYLSQSKATHSLLDISCVYTGQVNRYYAALLNEALALLKES